MSDDARFLAFRSNGTDLQGAGTQQVYLRDRINQYTAVESVSSAEVLQSGDTEIIQDACAVSQDGRYLSFASTAANLVTGDTNAKDDVFRRDRQLGTTERMSVNVNGGQATGGYSNNPSMSDDGAIVVFQSTSPNLVPLDGNGVMDVFQRIPGNPLTTRLSVTKAGVEGTAFSHSPVISGNGLSVAFATADATIAPGDDNTSWDIVVLNRTTGDRELASLRPDGGTANGSSYAPSISDDGRYVGFSSVASDLYPADGNVSKDAFRRDRQLDKTDLVSRTKTILPGNDSTADGASLSNNGRIAAYASSASDLVRNDTNGVTDAFVRDFGLDLFPFTSFESFVKQQYADFVGRQPTAPELAEGKAVLQNGELSPDGYIDAMAHRPEWTGKRPQLVRLYWAFFLRAPDQGGLDYWVGKLDGGKTLAQVASQFAQSSEFQTKYGSATNTEFVTLVYQNVLERDPDPAGLTYWVTRLDNGTKTRGDTMTNFSESPEGKRFLSPQVDLVLINLGMNRQMITKSKLEAVTASIKGGLPIEGFVNSERFGPTYHTRVTP
jgi:Tol biopolymer transport system component